MFLDAIASLDLGYERVGQWVLNEMCDFLTLHIGQNKNSYLFDPMDQKDSFCVFINIKAIGKILMS